MTIAIIDYGSGNLRSVAKAFERVAGVASIIQVTSSSDDLTRASHIVLPGVGAFADCMHGLQELPDMLTVMRREVLQNGKKLSETEQKYKNKLIELCKDIVDEFDNEEEFDNAEDGVNH